ncbi:S24/S26 family peptidase [Thermophagus sp. OGC60D27]|uniref:S24/S26 family peptidase n=1 Tax=Thermophagus sp. OGC60D27 TaxID=3458415 RepID=UPI0040384596
MTYELHQYHEWIDQLLEEGKTVQVTVQGMSMFPILLPGDSVQIRRIGFDEMRPGQVLIFEREGQWIAHRLMVKEEKSQYLTTRGDGLPRQDHPIPATQVKGMITGVVRSRSPFARSINTSADRWMVWLTPLTGRLFWYAGRMVVWGLKRLKRL